MKIRRTSLAATAAIIYLLSRALPAAAADLAPERRAYPPVPLFTWTGFYAGLNAGYAFGNADTILPTNIPALSSSYDGFVGGAQIGYNWQVGAAVLGFEADMQYADIKGTDIITAVAATATNTLEWFGTARGRVGYAFDRVLPYVTGGFAFGRNEYDFTLIPSGNPAKGTITHTGWTVGGGVEFAIRDAWSVKAEYLHVDLGSQSGARDVLVTGELTDFNLKFDLVRAGLNYRF